MRLWLIHLIRLRLRLCIWHRFPILFDSTHGWGLQPEDLDPSTQSRCTLSTLLRDWSIWLDGSLPDRYLQLETRDYHGNILVDDAGRYVYWSLDRRTNKLVAYHKRHQGAVCITRMSDLVGAKNSVRARDCDSKLQRKSTKNARNEI